MRQAFITALAGIARRDPSVWLLTGDLGFTVLEPFADAFPDRFVNVGVAEQNMMGMAAGLAATGKRVVCYSIAPFATGRPYEMVKLDIAGHGLPVTVVGVGAGVAYAEAGFTHHAADDIALMRAIPGMTVFSPAGPAESAWATATALSLPGPSYVRLGKSGEPDPGPAPAGTGVHRLREGTDIAVFATGPITAAVMDAALILDSRRISASVWCVHTLKPLDADGILRAVGTAGHIVTVEEHSVIGGLGSAVADLLASRGSPGRLTMLGIPDAFVRSIGSHGYVLDALGLSPRAIADRIASTV